MKSKKMANLATRRVVWLGLCVYFCPWLFACLWRKWCPDEREDIPDIAVSLCKRFWCRSILIGTGIVLLLFVSIAAGNSPISDPGDWVRVLAAYLALVTALSHGEWCIQTWGGNSPIERINRGMYVVGQTGAAALLILILTV